MRAETGRSLLSSRGIIKQFSGCVSENLRWSAGILQAILIIPGIRAVNYFREPAQREEEKEATHPK